MSDLLLLKLIVRQWFQIVAHWQKVACQLLVAGPSDLSKKNLVILCKTSFLQGLKAQLVIYI